MAKHEKNLNSLKKHSILGLLPLFKEIEDQGHDPEKMLARRGLSLDSMTGAAVISQELEIAIVEDAMQILDDPILGIKVGSQVSFTSYGTYAMLLMTANDFLEAARVGVQFQSLALLFSQMSMHFSENYLELRYTLPESPPNLKAFIADRDLMGTYMFMREMIGNAGDILLGMGTAREKPDEKVYAQYRKYIDVSDIQFDQPYNWIRVPTAILRFKQKHANKWAHKLYRVQAYELMSKFYPDADDVVAQVRQIIDGYDAAPPALKNISERLGMSERTLRRRLDGSGIKFRSLIDEHRKKRALDMLSQRHISVSELADALGYSESASFLRAFKRWTGTTPKHFKQKSIDKY